jgi:hypothetical protein
MLVSSFYCPHDRCESFIFDRLEFGLNNSTA